jgi:hypothetical protein
MKKIKLTTGWTVRYHVNLLETSFFNSDWSNLAQAEPNSLQGPKQKTN